jgi:hypothetical protein
MLAFLDFIPQSALPQRMADQLCPVARFICLGLSGMGSARWVSKRFATGQDRYATNG